MTRFVALGDSTTVGLGDPMPDGTWRGWAALLAASLGDVEFHNLARSGARAADVAGAQLAAALPLRPDLASVVVGVNDTLRDTFDAATIGRAVNATVASLVEAGAVVLTVRLPDPGHMFGLPAALSRPLGRRVRAINATVDLVAARYGTVHFDAAGHTATYLCPMWSVDRLHPSERGHRLLARCFADALAATGFPVPGRPALEPSNPEPTRRARARWMATKGARWVLARSTDLVPCLVAMAMTEWWHGVRGTAPDVEDPVAVG